VKGLYVGVPAVIGAGGVERIIELKLAMPEKKMLAASVAAVQILVGVSKKLMQRAQRQTAKPGPKARRVAGAAARKAGAKARAVGKIAAKAAPAPAAAKKGKPGRKAATKTAAQRKPRRPRAAKAAKPAT
jgi:hypothetical protein